MPKIYRPDEGEAVRREGWDAGDDVYLRPTLTTAMQREIAHFLPLPEGMTKAQFTALPEEERQALAEEQTDSIAIGLLMLKLMVVRWTSRYAPTPEQAAAGQPGDPIPLTEETLGALDPEDFQFLVDECQKRAKSLMGPVADGATEVPLAPATFPAAAGDGGEGQVPA